jgi:hypothetical protein
MTASCLQQEWSLKFNFFAQQAHQTAASFATPTPLVSHTPFSELTNIPAVSSSLQPSIELTHQNTPIHHDNLISTNYPPSPLNWPFGVMLPGYIAHIPY